MTTDSDKKYVRQAGILPPDDMRQKRVAIIGCGAVGRQLALQLASAGQTNIHLFDHDTVEEVNLGPQGWPISDLGDNKAIALLARISADYPDAQGIAAHPCRAPLIDLDVDVVFFCVDSIRTRERLFGAYKDVVDAIFDARVAGEVIRIISCCDTEQKSYYPQTLFNEGEAFQGTCTTKMTIFSANIAAGHLMCQYAKYLREFYVDRDFVVSLLASEIIQK